MTPTFWALATGLLIGAFVGFIGGFHAAMKVMGPYVWRGKQ